MESSSTCNASSDKEEPLEKRRKTESEESSKTTQQEFDPERLVPQLSAAGITEGDLKVAIKVLESVGALSKYRGKKNKKNKKDQAISNGSINDNDKSEVPKDQQEETGLDAYQKPNLRPLRKALSMCYELQKRIMFQGASEDQHYDNRIAERSLKRQKMAEKTHQRKYVAETALRKGRVERLLKLKQDGKEEELSKMSMMVPDGHVDTSFTTGSNDSSASRMLENGNTSDGTKPAVVVETVTEGTNKKMTKNNNENIDIDDTSNNSIQLLLPKMRSCYVCKVRFRELHHFYDQMCPKCAPLNWEKRHQTADCTHMVAVVTGSRVKIGYQTCLKLLRAGATVVATTRFPNSAVATYLAEPDCKTWIHRLQVFGLDLRDVTGLEAFTRFLKIKYGDGGIDILINNACQTIRRPVGYYVPMMEKEQQLWKSGGTDHKNILGGCTEFERVRRKLLLDHSAGSPDKKSTQLENGTHSNQNQKDIPLLQLGIDFSTEDNSKKDENSNNKANEQIIATVAPIATTSSSTQVQTVTSQSRHDETKVPFETTGVSHSAAMSQMVILPEDVGVADSILPPGVSDVNGQQLDLRTTNSWLLTMEQVSTPEIMECMFVNAIAPFVLNSRLKPLMTTPSNDDRADRYVINVSAMEGKFYRYKMPNHPHTNMAKAALNMLTRTSAEDLAKNNRIYMNSVDTGWINDENPLEKASKIAETNLFQTPIDEIDAAARILDPVFSGVNGGRESKKDFGKFLKDYRETEW